MLLIRQSLRWAVGNDYPSGLVDFWNEHDPIRLILNIKYIHGGSKNE